MVTIKSYTDLQQSMKLAEILPLESADMYYDRYGTPSFIDEYVSYRNIKNDKYKHLIAAWSLSALLGVLPDNYIDIDDTVKHPSLIKTKGNRYMVIYSAFQYTSLYNNPIDACYEMILKLNELNML